MKTWDQFLPDVLPSVPAASQPLARRMVMRAAQEFCRNTRAWVYDLGLISTKLTTKTYGMEFPDGAELVRIESAELDGSPIPVWRDGDRRLACSRFVYTRNAVDVLFSEQPGAGQKLALTVALEPGTDSRGVDDVIFRKYSEHIAVGAVARLSSDATKRADFEMRMADVRHRLWIGNADTTPRARASFF